MKSRIELLLLLLLQLLLLLLKLILGGEIASAFLCKTGQTDGLVVIRYNYLSMKDLFPILRTFMHCVLAHIFTLLFTAKHKKYKTTKCSHLEDSKI